ncbi:unnamed protein product [Durusdinium trenchii]|uniref:Secreted protein n=1 Tax=Durusdinium trenchii TaxID=1381693 RepID=A0ABP0SBW5_9DINO
MSFGTGRAGESYVLALQAQCVLFLKRWSTVGPVGSWVRTKCTTAVCTRATTKQCLFEPNCYFSKSGRRNVTTSPLALCVVKHISFKNRSTTTGSSLFFYLQLDQTDQI